MERYLQGMESCIPEKYPFYFDGSGDDTLECMASSNTPPPLIFLAGSTSSTELFGSGLTSGSVYAFYDIDLSF